MDIYMKRLYTGDYPVESVSDERELIVKYFGDLDPIEKDLNVKFDRLDVDFAILIIDRNQIPTLIKYPQIQFIEETKLIYDEEVTNYKINKNDNYSYTDLDKELQDELNNELDRQLKEEMYENFSGEGVLVCIIDSGIDYAHKEFIDDDNKSRIYEIWDQSIDGSPPDNFNKGHIYTNEEINNSINDDMPINHLDLHGHGTAVASRAAGGTIGTAPKSTLLIVKLDDRVDRVGVRDTDFMRAMKYCSDTGARLDMPISINISYGTNDGGHDGFSLFEDYVNEIASKWKTCVVVASGNEGASNHHYFNTIVSYQVIGVELTITYALNNLYLYLWQSFSDKINYEIVAPNGEIAGSVNFTDIIKIFYYKNTKITCIVAQPNHYNGDQGIYFNFTSINKDEFIDSGDWTLNVIGEEIVNGNFHIWLPGVEAVTRGTFFKEPNSNTSLTLPSTARAAITVGAFDEDINEVANFSGRGYTRENIYVKPDLIANGVNVTCAEQGNRYRFATGTSFSAPAVTGVCANLMSWGIVKDNSPFLFNQKVKAYLQIGCTRSNLIDYPNPDYGYGVLNIERTYDYLKNIPQRSLFEIQSETPINKNIYQCILPKNEIILQLLKDKKYIVKSEGLNKKFIIAYFDEKYITTLKKDLEFNIICEKYVPLELIK